MLIIKSLTVSYNKDPVIENMNIQFSDNCIHGLVGLNGSGKTTLFHTIFGMIKPDAGKILWDDAPALRKNMALLETQNYFYSYITGREYLQLFHSPKNTFKLEVWQELFNLPLNELIENYSTGMKKKLALLGILKLDKSILLLDEPFNGVDMETAKIIELLLPKLKDKGKTIIVTSHILETLTGTCDFIHYLSDKKVQKSYNKSEISNISRDIFGELEGTVNEMIGKAL